jgi:hypothetical protein
MILLLAVALSAISIYYHFYIAATLVLLLMLIDLTLRAGNPKKNPSNMSHQTICSIAFPLFLYFLQFTDKYVLEGYRLSHNFQFIH